MEPTANPEPDWRPTASLDNLRRRADAIARLRGFFADHKFWEVETPLLSRDTVVDRYLDPIAIESAAIGLPAAGIGGPAFYLQTSPEFGMKRLLAAGADRIFQIGRAFRAGERGIEHNPEFTMLEWYHRGDYRSGMDLLIQLSEAFWPARPCQTITYRELFLEHLSLDPWGVSDDVLRAMAAEVSGSDISRDASVDRDDCLNLILAITVQPKLGCPNPLIVCDWPASQAALARTRPDDATVAERFELYVDGREIANGYCELLDADELQQRARDNQSRRISKGKPPLPVTSRLVEAMQSGLPACCGVALGVDRLLMCLLNLDRIDDVIAFPIERA